MSLQDLVQFDWKVALGDHTLTLGELETLARLKTPLVRVRVKIRGLPKKVTLALAMVIDPGMFDKPVLLSTWLAAQENVGCNAHARVTSYSIQPGSAYTPFYGGGFTTDPAYTATESTLIGYSGLTTC